MDGATEAWLILYKKLNRMYRIYVYIYMNVYLFLRKPILKIRSLYAKVGQLPTDN